MNRIFKSTFLFLLFVALTFGQEWKFANGPYGAEIRKIAIDLVHPDTLYATGNGLYRSFDGGMNWTELILPVIGDIESDIEIDPNNANVIYYGSEFLLKSNDYGETWRDIGYENWNVVAITVDPVESQNVFVGRKNAIINGDVLWMSKDSGKTWEVKTNGMPSNISRCTAIEMNPYNQNQLYAATTWSGLFKSTDYAENWNYVGLSGLMIRDIEIVPWDTSVVFSATWSGLYRSDDGGSDWFKTLNGDISSLETDIENKIIYAGKRGGGVSRSMDNGVTWQNINNPALPTSYSAAMDVFDIKINPKQPEIIYIATGIGPYKTYNGGDSWSQNFNGLSTFAAFDIAVAPSDPTIIYAVGRTGVHRSNDGGVNWTYIGIGGTVELVEVHPTNPNIVFIVISGNDFNYRVLMTPDGGATWNYIKNTTTVSPYFIKFSPHPPYPVYIQGTNLLVSYDSAKTWQTISTPFWGATSIEFSKFNDNQIYACSFEGVYRSDDKGDSWTLLGLSECDNINRIGLKEKEDQTLYAACRKYGFYKNVNWNREWRDKSEGLLDFYFRDFIVNPLNQSHLFLASGLSGIYQSKNAGDSWELIDLDTLSTSVDAIAFDPTGTGKLYYSAGSGQSGVYLLDNVLTSIEENMIHENNSYILKQNYPNPFNTTTFIEYNLPMKKFVKLEIFDLSGRKIRTLINSSQFAGNYKIKWNGNNDGGKFVSSGIYIYQLSIDSNLLIKKMLLIK